MGTTFPATRDTDLSAMGAERRELVLRYELGWVERPGWRRGLRGRDGIVQWSYTLDELWPMVSVVPGDRGVRWVIKWNDLPEVRGGENARFDDREHTFVLEALEAADAWLRTAARRTWHQVCEETRDQRILEFTSTLSGNKLAVALVECFGYKPFVDVVAEPFEGGTRWWLPHRHCRDFALVTAGENRWQVVARYPNPELLTKWRGRLALLRLEQESKR